MLAEILRTHLSLLPREEVGELRVLIGPAVPRNVGCMTPAIRIVSSHES